MAHPARAPARGHRACPSSRPSGVAILTQAVGCAFMAHPARRGINHPAERMGLFGQLRCAMDAHPAARVAQPGPPPWRRPHSHRTDSRCIVSADPLPMTPRAGPTPRACRAAAPGSGARASGRGAGRDGGDRRGSPGFAASGRNCGLAARAARGAAHRRERLHGAPIARVACRPRERTGRAGRRRRAMNGALPLATAAPPASDIRRLAGCARARNAAPWPRPAPPPDRALAPSLRSPGL